MPGGTVVQYYYYWDYLNGVPFKNDSWDPDYDGEKKAEYNYIDLDEYIAFCRKVNSESTVGISIRSGKEFNMNERSLDEAKRLLTYCKEKQYNVKFWYIGNEGHAKGFSALKYAEYIDMYADVLKSVDPNVKIVADWKMGPYKKNRGQESIILVKASKSINVMEFHEKWGDVWGLKSGFTMEEWRNELPIYNGKLTTLIRRFKEEMQKDNRNIKVGFNEWGLGGIKDGTKFDHALVASAFFRNEFKEVTMKVESFVNPGSIISSNIKNSNSN